ncbi:MAG TPA: AI-2E family transporter [Candidatus Saccharimonadales bacterium]|nr:AI-2E family transporter [Candidatus Saccharimonadales bacterium]
MLGFGKDRNGRKIEVTVANRTVIKILMLVALWLLFLVALRQATHSLVLLFTAFFLALALNAPVRWLANRIPGKRRGSRVLGTAISFFLVIALLIGFLTSIVPPLVRQTSNFVSAAPQLLDETRDKNSTLGKWVDKLHLQNQLDDFSDQLSERVKNATPAAVSTLGKVGSSLFSVLTILALTFMMLVEGPRWMKLFERFVHPGDRRRVNQIATDMYNVVKGYVNGQVTLAFIAALMLLPALIVLHVSYPAALVVVVFVCGLIPMVGHTIGAIIVTLVALFHSPFSAIAILAYYILYQQIENYIIQPRIQANSTNMSPLLVFASVVIGVNFGGLFGGLVAIPVAGCVRILVLDYMRNRHIISATEEKRMTKSGDPGVESA